MSQWILRGLALLCMGASVAASAEETSSPSYAFGPGEQAVYRVSYLGITAGSATVTVGAEMSHSGRTVWPIVALAKTDSLASLYPVKDRFITYWDFEAQRSLGNDLYADENRKRRRQRVNLNHQTRRAQVLKLKEGDVSESVSHYDIAPNALDVAAAMFSLRNQTLEIGKRYSFPVFTGDRSFELHSFCDSRQMLQTALGPREVFKMRIRAQFSGNLESKQDMSLYVTTDPKHLPVRVEADFVLGSINAEITTYQPGREIALHTADGGASSIASSLKP